MINLSLIYGWINHSMANLPELKIRDNFKSNIDLFPLATTNSAVFPENI